MLALLGEGVDIFGGIWLGVTYQILELPQCHDQQLGVAGRVGGQGLEGFDVVLEVPFLPGLGYALIVTLMGYVEWGFELFDDRAQSVSELAADVGYRLLDDVLG